MRASRVCFSLLSISLITACDWGRTPSRERFEKNCHIRIPPGVQILRDEYQDMGADYAIYYTLKFNNNSLSKLTNSIKQSNYYDETENRNSVKNDSDKEGLKADQALWRASLNGYKFYKRSGRTEYQVEIDTINRIAAFEELAD